MIHNVGGEFGRRLLQNIFDARDDIFYRVVKCFGYFVRADVYIFRQAADHVAPAHTHTFSPCTGISRTDLNFNIFRRPLTNHQVVFFLNVKLNVAVEFVARHAKTFAANNSAQRNNGNVASSAADINDH